MIQRRYPSFLILGLCLMAVVGCGPESYEVAESARSTTPSSALSDEQTAYSRVGEMEDLSYGSVKRVSQRIVVPPGRTRDQLTATLDHAARELAEEAKANAAIVFAYRPQDNPSGEYSVGQAVYAPNGRWEEAASSAVMRVSVELNDLYFSSPQDRADVGEIVILKAPPGELIELSKEYGSWNDEDIISRVPEGTEGVVVERRAEPMGGQEFVRYLIRVTDRGREVNGWVHRSNVETERGRSRIKAPPTRAAR